MRILIAEDDLTSRILLQSTLAAYGECHVAVNGAEAVEIFRRTLAGGDSYDLICMDISMPDMDGHQAVQEIRRLEKAAKRPFKKPAMIVMTTASDDQADVSLAREEHCDAYLLKPIDTRRLKSLIWEHRLA